MTKKHTHTYPSISQSFGIAGIIILSMLIFSPVFVLTGKYFGKEFAFLSYYILTMGVPFLIVNGLRKKKNKIDNKTFDFSFCSTKTILLIILSLIAIQTGFIFPIVGLIPMPEYFQKMFMNLAEQNGIYSFISMVIAAPILEELIFRGIILDGLLKSYSPVKSIIISSLLFGIVHLNPWQFISAMIIGVFSGWIYYKTKKISLSILIHMVNNGLAFFAMASSTPEDMVKKPLTETYGGGLSFFLIVTLSAIFVAIIGILYLKQNLEIEFNLPTASDKDNESIIIK